MHINYILYLLNLFTDSRSNKYSSKIEDTRHIHATYILLQIKYYNTGCAKKKKDILNIHIKSEGINIFSQKLYWTESTIFVVKCQKFTFIV